VNLETRKRHTDARCAGGDSGDPEDPARGLQRDGANDQRSVEQSFAQVEAVGCVARGFHFFFQ
jgi:hypothetical protein